MLSSRLLIVSLLSAVLVACGGSDEEAPAGVPGSSGSGGSSSAGAAGDGGSGGSSVAGAAGGGIGGTGGSSGQAGAGGEAGVAGAAGAGAGGASGEGGEAGAGPAGNGGAGGQGEAGDGGSAGAQAGGTGGTAGNGGSAGGEAGAAGEAGAGGEAGTAGAGGEAGMAGAGGAMPCPEGYEGEACDQCAFGFVMDKGACVLACEVKDCGNGICSLAEDNTTYCTCDEGWAGAACDGCAPGYRPTLVMIGEESACELDEPSASAKNLALWLDADRDDSFLMAPGGGVMRWYSRVKDDSTYFSDGGVASARPERKASEVSARKWVYFDGVNDHLQRTLDLQTAGYSIFVVVQASATDQVQTVLSGVKVGTILHGLQLQATNLGKDLFFRHKLPVNGGASDDVTLANYPTSVATVVEVHRGVLGNQPLYQVYNGSTYVSSAGEAPAFPDELMLHLGIRGDSDTFPLEGRIGEVLIFSTTLSINERAKVRDYLKSKWLP